MCREKAIFSLSGFLLAVDTCVFEEDRPVIEQTLEPQQPVI